MQTNKVNRIVPISFRFPVKQVSDCSVDVVIPLSDNAPMLLNPDAIGYFKLSEREAAEAEHAALREIVIIH